MNATPSGQGAPLAVRIYQLGSAAAFEGAEFHRLYRGDAAALGTDLVKRDEYLLAPGSTRAVTLSPPDTVRSLGILAAYRDFQAATWRATAEVPPHKTTVLTVTAGPAGVTVAPGGR